MPIAATQFGKNIKALRMHSGMTLRVAAAMLGVDKEFLNDCERTELQPSFDMLMKIADLYGVTETELLRHDLGQAIKKSYELEMLPVEGVAMTA